MNTADLLNKAKTAQNLSSDYALAKTLKVSTAHVSQWRSGRTPIDDYNLLKITDMAKVSYAQALAIRALAKESNPERVNFGSR